jgi:hypothetical protein
MMRSRWSLNISLVGVGMEKQTFSTTLPYTPDRLELQRLVVTIDQSHSTGISVSLDTPDAIN